MLERDIVTWNSLIMGCIQNGCFANAMDLFKQMRTNGFTPKPELTASILSICSRTDEFKLGREIHGFIIVNGVIPESVFLSTAMVNFYMRSCDLRSAFSIFDQMKVRNEVSWTAMINGCTANHEYAMALDFFHAMQAENTKANRVTLISILPACAQLGLIKHGKEIHGYAFHRGFDSELCFSAAIIHMYCHFEETSSTAAITIMERSAERDIVTWGSIIGSFSRCGNIIEATKYFNRMQLEGMKPNSVTVLAMISACIAQPSIASARAIHCYALKSSLFSEAFVGNSILNMYAKCGHPTDSQQIFAELEVRDSYSWSSLISAYGISGCGHKALRVFHEMSERGVEADPIALLSTLSACSHAGLIEEGQQLFEGAIQEGKIPLTIEHYACQIDLLSRAGNLEEACEIVQRMPMKPSIRIWSSLVSACKDFGRLDVAERLASQLILLEPDNAANYTLLSMVYAKFDNWIGAEAVRRVMRVKGLQKKHGYSRIELVNV
ncbi:hypothetical protein Nepgr_007085 [Nepenthes gracilis]|uniref:Pentatricopeptide repeat-containing protein n=1 Tax=Nepenthes gracilis TaxID=150966 RepID=A0AAD3S6A8_NEPGR|nr:hypothetical protein Nepgr_007085 [Nepenthes gracilis]